MGKIRVKVLGDEEQEEQKLKEAKIKKEQKIARMVADGNTEEKETVILASDKGARPESDSGVVVSTPPQNDEIHSKKLNKPTKKEKFAAKAKSGHSKSYRAIAALVDKSKTYTVTDGLKLLEQLKRAKFDESVEIHINTTESGISGSLTLPHGTGKQLRVAIADEKLLAQVEKGIIDFDILLAQPSMMPKLAKVARVLGPKGLMPNPKNGTVTQDPESAIKKFQGGLMQYKTEAKSPIIHMIVGKISFGEKKLAENIAVVSANLATIKVKNVTLKLTQSPGIKISL